MAGSSTASRAAFAPDNLRSWRRSAGLTQRQLAGLAGCSLAWIAAAEGGYIPKRSPTLSRVLDVLEEATESAASDRADA
jgi:predicted transcriptional regulator